MTEGQIPVHLDPLRAAETGRRISGRMPLAKMERLAEIAVAPLSGEAEVDFEFGIDHQGLRYLAGTIQCEVKLECQRCLEPMPFLVDSEIRLAFVESSLAAEMLPTHYEPYLYDGQPLYLQTVVEDEILLSLPIVSRHSDRECLMTTDEDETTEETGQTPRNPFEVLAELKTKR